MENRVPKYLTRSHFVFFLKVLNLITEEVLMHDGSFKSVTDQCDYIKQSLSNNKSKLLCCGSFVTRTSMKEIMVLITSSIKFR